jgi:hypothetical protein
MNAATNASLRIRIFSSSPSQPPHISGGNSMLRSDICDKKMSVKSESERRMKEAVIEMGSGGN